MTFPSKYPFLFSKRRQLGSLLLLLLLANLWLVGHPSAARASEIVSATGTIVVVKNTVPDGPQDFFFITTGSLNPPTFSLDDDSDPTLPNVQTFTDLPGGLYTVMETAAEEFILTDLSCEDPSGGTTINDATAIIALQDGETVTCTFTNMPRCDDADADLTAEFGDAATTAFVTNHAAEQCVSTVGMAAYEKINESIDNQILFDFVDGVIVAAGETAELTIQVPICASQVDIFSGDVLLSLHGQRYGSRLLRARHVGGDSFCKLTAVVGEIEGFVHADGLPAAGVKVFLTQANSAAKSKDVAPSLQGVVLHEAMTTATGYFGFTGLEPSDYTVELSADSFPFPVEMDYETINISLTETEGAAVNFTAEERVPTAVTLSAARTTSSSQSAIILFLAMILLAWTIVLWQHKLKVKS